MIIDGSVLAYPIYAMCVVVTIVCFKLDVLINRMDREQRAQARLGAELKLRAHWVRVASEPPQYVVDELP